MIVTPVATAPATTTATTAIITGVALFLLLSAPIVSVLLLSTTAFTSVSFKLSLSITVEVKVVSVVLSLTSSLITGFSVFDATGLVVVSFAFQLLLQSLDFPCLQYKVLL